MLSFQNTEIAFRHKSDSSLRKSHLLFSMMGIPFLVKKGPALVNFALKSGLPVQGLIRKTLFEQFCGGESINQTLKTSTQLKSFGVNTILDYSVEGEKNEKGFDACRDEIIKTLEHSKHHREVMFTACKVSGLGNIDLLTKIQAGETLSHQERDEERRVIRRMEAIALAALRNETPVFFDAEETWFQTWIDEQCEILMKRFNNEKAIVYTTLQLYRHDRLEYLHNLHAKGKVEGFIPAVKLVRGAYLEKENLRAQTLGYQTPMHANKGATDQDFNLALRFCLDHIDSIALCAGTHNEESCYLLTHLMKEKGIANDHPYIAFAQLYGMSDHISYNLGSEGYRVAKYLPYGPVKSVLPYLFRRAEENTSIKGQTGRELELIRKELKRRSGKV